MNLQPPPWPNGAQCAVILTFDFDAESAWLATDRSNADYPTTLALGRYGATVGVPKILELLRHEGLRSTFFVPGWTADTHTARLEEIVADGHEIGHHGYAHLKPDPNDPARVDEELERGLEALRRTVGVKPAGYRAPFGVVTHHLLRRISELGFIYDSSFKDHYIPYRHVLPDGRPGLVEVPAQFTLDDFRYGMTHINAPRPLYTKQAVLSIWQDEFRELYSWGGVYTLIMHPQVTGRPIRLATLRELLAFIRGFPKVWFATASEVAQIFIDQEAQKRRMASD